MRISDWSSDVCSSDLLCQDFELKGIAFAGRMPGYSRRRKEFPDPHAYLEAVMEKRVRDSVLNFQMSQGYEPKEILPDYLPSDKESGGNAVLMFRSEEHTSELQSLMRISYAVFCLKK